MVYDRQWENSNGIYTKSPIFSRNFMNFGPQTVQKRHAIYLPTINLQCTGCLKTKYLRQKFDMAQRLYRILLVHNAFVRTNRHAIAMMFVCVSVNANNDK